MDFVALKANLETLGQRLFDLMVNLRFYSQLAIILPAIVAAASLADYLKQHKSIIGGEPASGNLLLLRHNEHHSADLLFPVFIVLFYAISCPQHKVRIPNPGTDV